MKSKPLILGHRGYKMKFPENTLLAFSKAFEYGADGIECDVQKSSDGIYFVFHDPDLHRITGYKGRINTVDSGQVRKLKAGEDQIVPDLDTFLDSLPEDKLINIELKTETLTVSDSMLIIDILEKRNLKDIVLISSDNDELLYPFKEAGFLTGLLFKSGMFENSLLYHLRTILKLRPWSVNLRVNVFTPLTPSRWLFLYAIKLLKIKVIFWAVNSRKRYNRIKNIAYAIITDEVEMLVKLRDEGVEVPSLIYLEKQYEKKRAEYGKVGDKETEQGIQKQDFYN